MANRYFSLRVLWLPLLVVAAVLLSGYYLTKSPTHKNTGESLAAFLSAPGNASFEQVTPDRTLVFPKDHGPHTGFRQEWWYFVGNLRDASGNRYGFQLTFFRFADGQTRADVGDSAWHTGHNWMAHMAITDVSKRRFITAEDFSRQALELTGAIDAPFGVWLNSWSVRQSDSACTDCFELDLNARYQSHGLALRLSTRSGPVLQGENGFSIKDEHGKIASWYYTIPDFDITGRLTIDHHEVAVSGDGWMDREWSSAILGEQQSGWDWFALHHKDSAKLMLFQVRSRDSATGSYRHGMYIDADGNQHQLDGEHIDLSVVETWKSRKTGVVYPSVWRLRVSSPSLDMEFIVRAAIPDQELKLLFTYYEGVAFASGALNGQPMQAEGYMEMTGYE